MNITKSEERDKEVNNNNGGELFRKDSKANEWKQHGQRRLHGKAARWQS